MNQRQRRLFATLDVKSVLAFKIDNTRDDVSLLAQDLISLSLGEYFITLSIDGESSGVFSAKTKVPAAPTNESNKQRIINRVRSTYGSTREEAERVIKERSESIPQQTPQENKNNSGHQKSNQHNRSHHKPQYNNQKPQYNNQKPHFNKNNPNHNKTKPHKEDEAPGASLKKALENIRVPSAQKVTNMTNNSRVIKVPSEQAQPSQSAQKEYTQSKSNLEETKKPQETKEIKGFDLPNE